MKTGIAINNNKVSGPVIQKRYVKQQSPEKACSARRPVLNTGNSLLIQRQENDKEKKGDHELPNQFSPADPKTDALSGGMATVADNLGANNPQFTVLTDQLKLKLWDNQPAALKGSAIGFAGASLALTYSALGISLFSRQHTALSDTLEDVNIAAPLSLIPFMPLHAFKYKYPSAGNKNYQLSGEIDVTDYLDVLHQRFSWFPKVEASFGLNLELDPAKGAVKTTGGLVNVKLLGGGLIFSGGVNQQFAPPPNTVGEPDPFSLPATSMERIPGPPLQTDTRFGLTVDIPNLINFFSPKEQSRSVQPKLEMTQPGDADEQEADAVAGQVMGMEAPVTAEPVKINTQQQEIQRKGSGSDNGFTASGTEQFVRNLSGGKPLNHSDKRFFESRIGYDFSKVRIHDDATAHQSAREINAKAYTHRNHIVFGAGKYQPGSSEGKKLLAHELTHTVQQQGGTGKVQRERELNADESKECFKNIDESITKLDASAADAKKNLPAYIKEAIEVLKQKRKDGKVKCYAFEGMKHGRVDYAKDEIHYDGINTSWINETTILHEAVHALHGKQNPVGAKKYGASVGKPVDGNNRSQLDLLKWKAWTEYWAYRSTQEYYNDTQQKTEEQIHNAVIRDIPEVRVAVNNVKQFDKSFDPRAWKPAG